MNILNPRVPDADWDLSGLFTFDHEFSDIIRLGKIFYDCDIPIKSIHGCYPVMWNAGRIVDVKAEFWGDFKTSGPEQVIKFWDNCWTPIGCYLTFSNHLIKEKHLEDPSSNFLLDILTKHNRRNVNGVIVSSDILSEYIRKKYPQLKQKSSIIKASVERPHVDGRDFEYYDDLTNRFDRVMVHPDDGHNKKLLEQMAASGKQDSYEIILNENCPVGCAVRKPCYAVGARDAIRGWNGMFHLFDFKQEYGAGGPNPDPRCGRNNYFHPNPAIRTTKRTCNFTQDELEEVYKMGFKHFKLQGRDDRWEVMFYDFIRYAIEPDHIAPKWMKDSSSLFFSDIPKIPMGITKEE